MGTTFEEPEKLARALSPKAKAALVRILIDERDTALDSNAEGVQDRLTVEIAGDFNRSLAIAAL